MVGSAAPAQPQPSHHSPWPPPPASPLHLHGPPQGLGRYGLYSLFPGATDGPPRFATTAPSLHSFVSTTHKVSADSLFSTGFTFGAPPLASPLGSPLASPGSGSPGPLQVPTPIYQQQAGPFIDNCGASSPLCPRWDLEQARTLPAPGLGRPIAPLAVNVKLEGSRGGCIASPRGLANANGTPLQSPQPSGLLSPGADPSSSSGCSRTTPRNDVKREPGAGACQVAEVTTSGELKKEATLSPRPDNVGGALTGVSASVPVPAVLRCATAGGTGFQLVRDPATGQFLLLAAPGPVPGPSPATAPHSVLGPAPGLSNIDPIQRTMLWPEYSPPPPPPPPPLLLSQSMQGGVLLEPLMSPAANAMTICQATHTSRTLEPGPGHTHTTHTHHAVSAVSSLALPQPTLLTVASMCHSSSTECHPSLHCLPDRSRIARTEYTNGFGLDLEQRPYLPRSISDGEPAVTKVGDPAKQCCATVQTQMETDTIPPLSASFCKREPEEVEVATDLTVCKTEPPGSGTRDATMQTDLSQSDSDEEQADTDHVKPFEVDVKETVAQVAEADSNSEQTGLKSPELLISSSAGPEKLADPVPHPASSRPPVDLDVSGLELLYKSIEHLEGIETLKPKIERSESVPEDPRRSAMPTGLGLLCALAEQRIQEEIISDENKRDKNTEKINAPEKTNGDVNRNYRTPKSEQGVKRFLATRQDSSQSNYNSLGIQTTQSSEMDTLELEMRSKLAELQRKYKEKQRELSRLTPRKTSTEGDSSASSQGSPRDPKRNYNRNSQPRSKKQTSASRLKRVNSNKSDCDPPPPVLERVTDLNVCLPPKLKWSRLDAPPTLTPHKPPEEDDAVARPPCKLNLVKLPSVNNQKRRWSVESPSPSARFSTETLHADDEDSDDAWLELTNSPNFEEIRKHKSSVAALHSSSSKRRKIERPKKNVDSARSGSHSTTETIVAKQSKSKSNYVSFLLASKSAGAPGKFPTAEHRAKENFKTCEESCESSPEHRPKIRPKLKAEVKVKETVEDEEVLEWPSVKQILPTDPLRPINQSPRRAKKVTSNGHHRIPPHDPDEDTDWVPNKPKIKPGITIHNTKNNNIALPKFSVKVGAAIKIKKPAVLPKERRISTDKHLKKPVCTSVEEIVPELSGELHSCTLSDELLTAERLPARTLTARGGLFYAGQLSAVRPPDLYSVLLDGERASRPNIYSREEVLQDTILEVRAPSVQSLPLGTRLCAYWSQQTRCLYPGTVASPSSPDPELDQEFVNVEFDDGDSGRIRIEDIRLLPPDYPIVVNEPNPLLTLGKRRRRNSGMSTDSKDRRASADSTASSSATTTPANVNQDLVNSNEVNESERKRLKKRRREKLKRLMSASAAASSAEAAKRKHKHRHRKHHKHRRRDSSLSSSSGTPPPPIDKKFEDKNSVEPEEGSLKSQTGTTEQFDEILETSPVCVPNGVRQNTPSPINKIIDHAKEDDEKENKLTDGKKRKLKDQQKDIEVDKDSNENKEKSSATPLEEDLEVHPPTRKKAKKRQERQPSCETSKMAAFLPAQQLWGWSGKGHKRPRAKGRGKKEYFKCIQRGTESITVGDCAVFLSTGRPDRPYIGRIESLWETWNGGMVVRVKWFYHPEETQGFPGTLKYPGGLFQSDHADDNDVQTISHRCEVLTVQEYEVRMQKDPERMAHVYDNNDVYYLAGFYDPTNIQIRLEKGVV